MSVLITGGFIARSATMLCWAENGLVHYEITRLLDTPQGKSERANRGRMPGDYGALPIAQAKRRAAAIKAMIGTSDEPGIEKLSGIERRELIKFLEDFEQVIAQAEEQGEFGDKSMMEARKRALPVSVSMAQQARRQSSRTMVAGIPQELTLEGSVSGKLSPRDIIGMPVPGTLVGRKATVGRPIDARQIKSKRDKR